MKIIELFAGIGACTTALKRLGIDLEIVDAVEIDKYAMASFNAIHNTNFKTQDIRTYNKTFSDIDLITHGSPCQDFSIAGKQAGGDLGSGTRSSLLYETIRIVGQMRPKYVLWENVKNILGEKHKHNFDTYIKTMNILGYNNYYQVLNAKDYGIPQNRERVYTVSIRKDIDKGNFKFPEKEELKLRLKDMLEDGVDEKYYLKDYQIENIKKSNFIQNIRRIQKKEYCDTLCARDWKDPKCVKEIFIKNATKKGYEEAIDGDSINLSYPNSNTRRGRVGHQVSQTLQCNDSMGVVINNNIKILGNYMPSKHNASRVVDNTGISPTVKENHSTVTATNVGIRIRKLTPKECWRLMGFRDEDFEKSANIPTSNTQLYKQAGNSIVVNVLEKIFEELLK